MVLKLYGSIHSTCTKRVATVLAEKKVPFELVVVDFSTGAHKAPDYLKKQPFGQVPYIDDDGFILFESRAICRYICAKHPDVAPGLLPAPTDLKAHALFEQAASIESFNFDPYASKAVSEKVFKPFHGGTPDLAVFDQLITTLDAKLDGYDQILAQQKYLTGDTFTLADLFHLPYGSMLAVAGSDIMTKKPNVARWWADITSRPSWQSIKDGVKSTA